MKKTPVVLALLCSMLALASLRAETIRFGQTGQVTITPPQGWLIESEEDAYGPGNHRVTLIADKSRKPGCTITIATSDRLPAYTEADFLAYSRDLYVTAAANAKGAMQVVEKEPSFKKLNVSNGFGYSNIMTYKAQVGKAPAKGTAKVCEVVAIYRENSPFIKAELYVDDPKDPALDLMKKAICEMDVSFPPLPANLVQFSSDDSIKIDIPAGWGTLRGKGPGMPNIDRAYRLELKPPADVKAEFTLRVGNTKTGKPLTKQQFDAMSQTIAGFIIPKAVEKKAAYKAMQIRGGRGMYCVFTDASLVNKKPGPHQYKYAVQFAANYDNGHFAYATLLTDDPSGASFQLMMKTFASVEPSFGAMADTPPAQTTKDNQGTQVGIAASPKKLIIPSKSLKDRKERRGGGTNNPGYFYFEDTKTGVLISGWLEPVDKFQYSSARKMWDSENAKKPKAARAKSGSEEYQKIGDWDVYLYDAPVPPQFKNTSNTHLRANYLDDKIWIDVHLSLTRDRPSKELRNALIAYLKTLVITDTEPAK